ncbi:MAG: redoxin domain-containing protein [Bacteroidota bacterium]
MAIEVGTPAPNFTLFSSEKQEVSLDSYKGKNVVLLFFPAAFTSVCTEEMCHMRDHMEVYNGLDAEIFGLSVDTPWTLEKFKAEQNLNFPLLSDFNKTVADSYGVLLQDFAFGMKGVAERAAIIIDKEGVVRYVEVTENPGVQVKFDALKETLSSLN